MFLYFQILSHCKKLQRTNSRSHKLVPKIRWLCWQHINSKSHELVPKIMRLCLQHTNSQSHELVPKIRRLCLQHTHSRSHELVPKIRWLCLQHMNARTHKHTILRKRCGACVCCINAQSHKLQRYFQKKGCWVCLLQLTNLRKVKKKSKVSWVCDLKPKCLYYFCIFKVYKSQTHTLGIVGLSLWVCAFITLTVCH